MVWAINGTPNTLGSAGDDCDITDLDDRQFNVFMTHLIASGSIRVFENFNNNTNSVYATRVSENGAADATATSQTTSNNLSLASAGDNFVMQYVVSISGEEKLCITFAVDEQASGAGTAPGRVEQVMKFVPSPDAGITRIDFNNTHSGSYDTDSNTSALGTD